MFDVLIVEDDPMVALINKQYVMKNPSFRICGELRDGVNAWNYLKNNKVDLIILDQYMPKMTGLELLRKIRKSEIPVDVIMVTAANDASSVDEALRLGVIDYLVKPFSSSRFNKALETFMTRVNIVADNTALNQKGIDDLINGIAVTNENVLPKGIQEVTLKKVRDFFKSTGSIEVTGERIAQEVGVSVVTVRHYTNYLIDRGEITGRLDYETGGRPKMLYTYNSYI